MNNDLTILLILKDKTPFTWRWMSYANSIKLPYKVIIADGGKDPSLSEKLANASQFPNVNYDYVRYPYDEDIAAYFLKLANASKLVKTPFVLLASNHDFYFPDSIKESLAFLKSNLDYSSARGEIYDITVHNQKVKGFHKTYFNPTNDANTGLERLEAFSKQPGSLWHDVNRTENIQKAFAYFHTSGVNDIVLAEYLLNALIVINGKTHRGARLHMLHQELPDGLGLTLSKRDPIEWVASENWPEHFLTLLNIISKELSICDKIAEKNAYNRSLQIFLAHFLGKNIIFNQAMRKSGNQRPFFRYADLLGKNNFFRKFLKKIYLSAKNRRRIVESSRMFPYLEEIKFIEDFLSKVTVHKEGIPSAYQYVLEDLHNRHYENFSEYSEATSSYWRLHNPEKVLERENGILAEVSNLNNCLPRGIGDFATPNLKNKCKLLPQRILLFYLLRRYRCPQYLTNAGKKIARDGGRIFGFDSVKQVLALQKILKILNKGTTFSEQGINSVCVIGDGYGFLSSLIKSIDPNVRVVSVNLGRVLLLDVLFSAKSFPELEPTLLKTEENKHDLFLNSRSLFIEAEKFELLNGLPIDLFINIAGMMEMDPGVIEKYFQYMRSSPQSPCYFYCCNRLQKELPDGTLTSFMKYPWQDSRIILDELCPWYQKYPARKPPFWRPFGGPIQHRFVQLK